MRGLITVVVWTLASAALSGVDLISVAAGFGLDGEEILDESTESQQATIWDGVYTPSQAERGRLMYEQVCGYCHRNDLSGGEEGAPALRGGTFLSAWHGKPIGALLAVIRETMPRDAPGSLSADVYADIVSFVLKENEVPAAGEEFRPDAASNDHVLITHEPRSR